MPEAIDSPRVAGADALLSLSPKSPALRALYAPTVADALETGSTDRVAPSPPRVREVGVVDS